MTNQPNFELLFRINYTQKSKQETGFNHAEEIHKRQNLQSYMDSKEETTELYNQIQAPFSFMIFS